MLYKNGKQIGFIIHNEKCIDNIEIYQTKVFEQGYTIEEHSTLPAELDGTIGKNLISYKISGQSKTVVVPGSNPPIQLKGVGDLVTVGQYQGKYLIPVTSRNTFINPATILRGYEIKDNYIVENPQYSVTDYIPVNYHNTYIGKGLTAYVLEYKNDNTFLQMVTTQTINGSRVYKPTSKEVTLIKLCMFTSNINTAIFEIQGKDGSYDEYDLPITTSIYLDRPLYKDEYLLKTPTKSILHKVYGLSEPQDISVDLPDIPTYKAHFTPIGATTIFEINTEVQCPEMVVKYKSAHPYNPQPLKTSDGEFLYTTDGEPFYTIR